MKLCIFPNDSILSYYLKGEIKKRYFNPDNFFHEIHIISLTDNDVSETKVKIIAGNATLKIHSVGKINLKNRTKNLASVKNLVKSIKPDVIRAYNPLLAGWLAANCAKTLKIPFLLSLHTQFDYNRKLVKKYNLKKFLALKYTEKFIEPFVLKNADKITIVFRIIEPYVLKHGGQKPELLYNRIDLEQFSHGKTLDSLPQPLIISVGNLIKEKNHECLINTMKNLNAFCLIIGSGTNYENLTNLIKKENLENRVFIRESVPHNEIQNYYNSAKVFALAYDPELEGLPMPVMEAMASGLPVVIPFPKKDYSDGLENVALFCQRTSQSFSENIQKILEDEELRRDFSIRSQNKAREFDNVKIEKREAKIYSELTKK